MRKWILVLAIVLGLAALMAPSLVGACGTGSAPCPNESVFIGK